MMGEIGTMVLWNRHLLSHHCPQVIILVFNQLLSRWQVQQTRKMLIITQNNNPPQQSTITFLAFLERRWQ
jgi:hypothetical protein